MYLNKDETRCDEAPLKVDSARKRIRDRESKECGMKVEDLSAR